MSTFILASNNRGKYTEFKRILSDYDCTVIPQAMAGLNFEVNETGETFEENAFLKASTIASCTMRFPAIADDSGLCVDALDGAPGVYSARFGGGKAWTDAQKNEYLLQKLDGVTDRKAKFVCCICCVFPDGTQITARGECCGRILDAPRGEHGFGYDPIFAPDGYDQSFAELGDDIKNTISHRARALSIFKEELDKYYHADR